MSQPIKVCTIAKAAKGDQEAFDWLVKALHRNLSYGAFTMFPCDHQPPCESPSEEQLAALDKRVADELAKLPKQKSWLPRGAQGQPGRPKPDENPPTKRDQ